MHEATYTVAPYPEGMEQERLLPQRPRRGIRGLFPVGTDFSVGEAYAAGDHSVSLAGCYAGIFSVSEAYAAGDHLVSLASCYAGICLVRQLVCLVIDEAHRALGNYSYCVAVRELMAIPVQLRILALTATPGCKS
ncbi:Fanconi anemia group M protein [Ananas comosus]|uniref:Fanconi anemia group M protein n=1 Tax=Ananas comosus TaxID=4615 RepID=A0A199ULF0_ANACO|nr:Fanconi anemia group M protein [Ananas comosus]